MNFEQFEENNKRRKEQLEKFDQIMNNSVKKEQAI